MNKIFIFIFTSLLFLSCENQIEFQMNKEIPKSLGGSGSGSGGGGGSGSFTGIEFKFFVNADATIRRLRDDKSAVDLIFDTSVELPGKPYVNSSLCEIGMADSSIYFVDAGATYEMVNVKNDGTHEIIATFPDLAITPTCLNVYNDELYFYAATVAEGNELWKTDGTAAGTSLVKDINPGAGSSHTGTSFTYFNGRFVFKANDGTNGNEIWQTDGTNAGTTLLVDLRPGANSSNPSLEFVMGDKLYYTANIDGVKERFYERSIDGTTKLVMDDTVSSVRFTKDNSVFYIAYWDNGASRYHIYIWNPATGLLSKILGTETTSTSDLDIVGISNNELYYVMRGNAAGANNISLYSLAENGTITHRAGIVTDNSATNMGDVSGNGVEDSIFFTIKINGATDQIMYHYNGTTLSDISTSLCTLAGCDTNFEGYYIISGSEGMDYIEPYVVMYANDKGNQYSVFNLRDDGTHSKVFGPLQPASLDDNLKFYGALYGDLYGNITYPSYGIGIPGGAMSFTIGM